MYYEATLWLTLVPSLPKVLTDITFEFTPKFTTKQLSIPLFLTGKVTGSVPKGSHGVVGECFFFSYFFFFVWCGGIVRKAATERYASVFFCHRFALS